MHAIDDVRVDDFVDGFAIAQIRWATGDLGPSHHTGQALILIPSATGAVVLRRPVPRSRADSPIAQIRANDRCDKEVVATGLEHHAWFGCPGDKLRVVGDEH
jgi:hypothetical protein